MTQIIEMAKELVDALIRVHRIPPDEVQALLQRTHATLLSLDQRESPGVARARPSAIPEAAVDWKRSIQKHSVSCLVCGTTFRQLSARHLSTHGLTPRSYRVQFGIPSTQPLSAREVTVRRRELARQIRPWELAHTKGTRAKSK